MGIYWSSLKDSNPGLSDSKSFVLSTAQVFLFQTHTHTHTHFNHFVFETENSKESPPRTLNSCINIKERELSGLKLVRDRR